MKMLKVLFTVAALAFAAHVYADDAAPAQPAAAVDPLLTAPLAVRINPNFTFRVNVSVGAFAYDVTHNTALGQVVFAGFYVLDYKDMIGVGLGASFATNDLRGASIAGLLASPSLKLGPATSARLGLIGQYRWLEADHAWIVGLAPTLQF